MPKCDLRIVIESAMDSAGLSDVYEATAFTDKSQSGWRIKYASRIGEDEMNALRIELRKVFPTNDFRIWYVPKRHVYGVGGTAIKIFK